MSEVDMATIQGMLDARLQLSEGEAQTCVINPYDQNTESHLWDAWWRGNSFHRSPEIMR